MSNQSIAKILVVGGTHGNELTGIQLVQEELKNPTWGNFDGLQVELLLANTAAIQQCRRYTQKDLNRCFTDDLLHSANPEIYEVSRAQEINQTFGPKGSPSAPELVIDIHNSTANMGISLIVSQLNDPLILGLCSYLSQKDPLVKVYYQPEGERLLNPYLPSIGKRDLCIEVGPQAHGTLRPELYVRTQQILIHALEYCEDFFAGVAEPTQSFDYYRHLANVDFPRHEDGEIKAMIHPQIEFADYQVLEPGDPIFLGFDGVIHEWNGDKPVWPLFINEAAYYEKNLALSLTQKERYLP